MVAHLRLFSSLLTLREIHNTLDSNKNSPGFLTGAINYFGNQFL